MAESFHATDDSAMLMRFRPLPTVSASLTASGSSGTFSVVHSQNEAMSAARSMESFDSSNPDSMMGIKAAAARRRLMAGVDGGIWFGIASF
jgi:hypothetical protein